MEENWGSTLRSGLRRARSDAKIQSCWLVISAVLEGKVDVGGQAIDLRSMEEDTLIVVGEDIVLNDWGRRRQHLPSC